MYASGANYTANASDTLYAIWKANTYTVTYDANGGSDAPATQTKTYGQTLTLSSTKPTRTNYNFLGWGTSAASTTVAYAPGAEYTGNSAITLYAIWELAFKKPTIDNLVVDRCTAEGVPSDEGTYIYVTCNWTCDGEVDSVLFQYKRGGDSDYIDQSITGQTGSKGSFIRYYNLGSGSDEYTYDVRLTVTDSNGQAITISTRLLPVQFEIDLLNGGGGVAIGKPATNKGFEIAYDTTIEKKLTFETTSKILCDDTEFMEFQSNKQPTFSNHIGLANGIWLKAASSILGTSFTNLLRINAFGEVELNWTSGGLKGRVMKEIWNGTWSSGSITIPDLPYYNMLLLRCSEMAGTSILVIREINGASIFRGGTLYAYEASTGANAMYICGFCAHTTNANGTTLNMDKTHMWSIYSNTSSAANSKNLTITKIVGVI